MITGSELISKFSTIDQKLDVWTVAVGLGGTSMTMLNIKHSTRDIDFILEEGDTTSFKETVKDVYGHDTDIFGRCFAYKTKMPGDYLDKSIKIAGFNRLTVYAMDPLDVIITKMSRGEERDFEDCKHCLRHNNYAENTIRDRMNDYEHDTKIESNIKELVERYL